MKAVFKFHWDCGRMGDLEGVFVATKAKVANAIGMHADFGEALGKHSQIDGVLKATDIRELTDDPDFVEKFVRFGLASGYNPLEYIEEEDEE